MAPAWHIYKMHPCSCNMRFSANYSTDRFRIIDEAGLGTSYLHEAGLVRNAFSVVAVEINLQD